jgi:glycosyltransferase involved in cell wall biosynthesis
MTTDQPVIDASARRGHEDRRPTVRILGTHGVPANYGGFETAAEKVGLHLLARGWRVVIYCQVEGRGPITYDEWQGIERVNVPVDLPGWRGTSLFDLKCVRHAGRYRDLNLVFGYNTGIFNIWQRLKRIPMVINMDGIEWSRSRWGFTRQAILYINERFSALFGNHLIADHPEIEKYLWTRAPKRKVTMIAYGADEVLDADDGPVRALGLEPGGYLTLICRPIPENSILELVEGFSRRPRGIKLALLGNYRPAEDEYHRAVVDAASDEVVFLGAIFDPDVVQPLRFHSAMYLHGHTVGGTNPSLVEALGAGNPVLAHDNAYNRWTAGPDQAYFTTADDVAARLDSALGAQGRLTEMSSAARRRYRAGLTWDQVGEQYRHLLERYLPVGQRT